MARLSLRDRFFTPPVARAITSPTAILAVGVGAGIAILAGGGVIGAIALGAAAFAGRVAAAIPRAPQEERIDPFTLSEPWRHYVQDAVHAHRRFKDAGWDAMKDLKCVGLAVVRLVKQGENSTGNTKSNINTLMLA